MTSKTSNKYTAFNRCISLMGWTIKKYKYTLLIYTILLFLSFPMMAVFCITSKVPMTFEGNDTGFIMYNAFFSTVAVSFSVIISFINFAYMQKKTSVDWYFSFPMTRRNMFVSKYLASAVMSIVPVILISFIGLLIQVTTIDLSSFFASLMMLILAILSNISFVALLSVCCGTTIDGIISYCVISMIYPIAWALVYYLPTLVLPGYVALDISMTLLTALVPFVSHYMGTFLGDLDQFTSYQFIHIGWWLLFTVLCTAGSIVLIKRRRTEAAQNAFAFNIPAIIIKIVSGFVGGVALGLLFSVLSYSSDMFYLWFLAGAVIGAFCVTFLLHIIYARGTKGYSRSLLQFACAIVLISVFFISLITGWFGYVSNVPKAEDVKSVGIYLYDSEGGYSLYTIDEDTNLGYNHIDKYITFEDKETIEDAIKIHQGIVNNLDNIYDFPYNFDSSNRAVIRMDEDNRFLKLKLNYTLNNGRHITREYEYGELSGEVQNMLADFVTSRLYDYNIISNYVDRFTEIISLEYIDYETDTGILVNQENFSDMDKMLEALKTDIYNNKDMDESDSDAKGKIYITASDKYHKLIRLDIVINDNFENVMALLSSVNENAYSKGYADLNTETA